MLGVILIFLGFILVKVPNGLHEHCFETNYKQMKYKKI